MAPELTYVGGNAAIVIQQLGNLRVLRGETIEVEPTFGGELLEAVGNWEAANEEAEELVPFMPNPVIPFVGHQGVWDELTYYSEGIVVEEGGGSYLALTPNHGKKPSSHAEIWQPIAKEGPEGPEGAEPEVPIVTTTTDYVVATVPTNVVANAQSKNLKVKLPKASAGTGEVNVANTATNANTVTVIAPAAEIRGVKVGPTAEFNVGTEQVYGSVTLLSDGEFWNII